VSNARSRVLPAAALMLLAAAGAGGLSALPGGVRFLVTLATLVWLPGAVLCRRIAPAPRSAARDLTLSFFLGASALSLLAWTCTRLGVSLGALALLMQLVAALAGVSALIRPDVSGGRSGREWLAVLALCAGLVAVSAAQSPVPGIEEDAYDHIGHIRRIVATGALQPGDVTATPPGQPPAPPDPRKGTLHALLAVSARVAAVDPFDAWTALPALLYPLATLAFLGFCAPFVRGRGGVAAAAALFLLTYGGLGFRLPQSVAYGQNVAVAWLWAVVPLALAPEGASRRGLVALAVLATGGVFVHAGVALHLCVLGATLLLFAGVLGVGRRGARRVGVVLLASAAAAGAWKAAVASGTVNVIHAHTQGVMFITPRWLVLSPMEVLRQNGLLFLGALVLLPLAAMFARDDLYARRALAFAALPVIVCFVPWTATWCFDAGSYMAFRSLLNFPALAALVTVWTVTVRRARAGGALARTAAAIVLAGWSIFFVPPTLRAMASDLRHPERRADADFRPSHAELINYLRHLPDGAVVLSDPRTSYVLSALTDHRFVAVYGQHGNPLDPEGMDRLRAVRDVLSPYATSAAAVAACARYRVDIVVVNGRIDARADAPLSFWDRAFYPATVARLSALPGNFREMFARTGFTAFLCDPDAPPVKEADGPPAPYAFGAAGEPCGVEGPGGGYGLTSVAIEPATALPGETVQVVLGYTRWDDVPFGLPVDLHVRFDHEQVAAARAYPLDKQVRRLRERWGGQLQRMRLDHRPLGGLLDPDLWPLGAEFHETVPFTVPAWAKHGRYRVEVSMRRESVVPNFTLSDLTSNRDSFSATPCATLDVVRQRVQ